MPTTTWTATSTTNYTVNPDFNQVFDAVMGGTAYPTNAPHKVTSATITFSSVTMYSTGRNFYAKGMGAAIGDVIGSFINDGNSTSHSVTYNCTTGEFASGGGYNGITKIGAQGNAAGTGTAMSIRTGCVITQSVTWEYSTSAWINVSGVWRRAIPWVNVGGTWHKAIMWRNVGGTWKRGI